MASLITLVRHGQSTYNASGHAQGQGQVPLSELGHQQARLLARHWPFDGHVDAIYSSDLLRCRQTVAPLAERMALPVYYDARFRELDVGVWQDLSFTEIREQHADSYAAHFADPYRVPIPGGEDRTMLAERVVAGLSDVLAAHLEGHAVIVMHGGPILEIIRHFRLWDYVPFSGDEPPVYNTSRATIQFTDGEVVFVNPPDVTHLPPDMVT